MGKWAKRVFGQEQIGNIGIALAGTANPDFEKKLIGMFDQVLFQQDSVYHTYLLKKGKMTYPVVSNIYGAPAMVDVLTEMHDGGCKTVIFVGYAYGGFRNLEVGSVVVPSRSYHFDGLYHAVKLDRTVARPDKLLKQTIEKMFQERGMIYHQGTNISVPAVTFQLPHHNKEYLRIQPVSVEMELAACLSRGKDIGVRTAGVLIISDNRSSSIGGEEKRQLRYETKLRVLEAVIANLGKINVPPLKTKKEFSIDEHLASIIEDPKNHVNVYRS